MQGSPHHPHRLPSVIAHHRGVSGCQDVVVVRLRHGSGRHASLPLLSGQDLDWVGGFAELLLWACATSHAPPTENPAMT